MTIDSRLGEGTATNGQTPGEMAAHVARTAARLFAAHGYDATSVREVVEAAGVTKPTLYYHFGSKQGLAEALLTRPMTEFVARLRALVESGPEPGELLRRTFAEHMAFLHDEPDRARFFYAICFGANCSTLKVEICEFGESIQREMIACARYAAGQGLIDPGRVEAFAEVFRGMVIMASLDFLFGGREPDSALPDRIIHDLLRGFALDRPSPVPPRGDDR